MNKQCTECVVSAGTHKPAEALHQQIDEPQDDAMRGNTAGGVRCHDADACAMGQLPCPTPVECGCAAAPQAVHQIAEPAAPSKPLTDAQIKEGRNAVNDDPDDRPEPWAFREGVKFAERMHGIKD